jgi:hypothetical protein
MDCTDLKDGKIQGFISYQDYFYLKIGKVNPVTSNGGPYDCETYRLPHFLDNRLTDDDEIISLKRRSPFTPQQEYTWYSFLLEAESTPGP